MIYTETCFTDINMPTMTAEMELKWAFRDKALLRVSGGDTLNNTDCCSFHKK